MSGFGVEAIEYFNNARDGAFSGDKKLVDLHWAYWITSGLYDVLRRRGITNRFHWKQDNFTMKRR
jgi:hypothetical protein